MAHLDPPASASGCMIQVCVTALVQVLQYPSSPDKMSGFIYISNWGISWAILRLSQQLWFWDCEVEVRSWSPTPNKQHENMKKVALLQSQHRYLCLLQPWILRELRGGPWLCSKESCLVPWLALENKIKTKSVTARTSIWVSKYRTYRFQTGFKAISHPIPMWANYWLLQSIKVIISKSLNQHFLK